MSILLGKLLQHEEDNKMALQMKLELFTANLELGRFPETIHIGEDILSNPNEEILLGDQNREALVVQTAYAWLKRGKYPEAKKLIEKHASFLKTFEIKISIEAEVYLRNNDPDGALNSVVEAVRILKRPSPEEYGSLFLVFSQIGNLMDFPLVSQDEVQDDSFVKLKGQEKWYFIGDKDELDAIKTPDTNRVLFLHKRLGEKVIFDNKYSSKRDEREIEHIFPTRLWHFRVNFL